MLCRADFESLDAADPLGPMRAQFALPDGVIYLDGNSLGPLPRATPDRLADVVRREWGDGLIRSWNDAGWLDLAARIGGKIARLIGAPAASVAVGDSTSVNMFKALAAALALRRDRRAILTETDNFPTDLYVADGLAGLLERGHVVRRVPSEAVADAIGADTAVVMLTHVNYRTGAMHDMSALTRLAHRHGALVVWDLAHSAGAVPLDVTADEADMAVGCGYKFLNGGPGAPGFLYVAPRWHASLRLPITGWLGHAAPFAFEDAWRPAEGLQQAAVGTPPILSLAALEVGVDLMLQAPMPMIRAKSIRQTALFVQAVAEQCGPERFGVATPTEPDRRGSQVSLRDDDGYPIMQALIERGVIGDFRAPNIMRFGIAPLYTRYVDLWAAARALAEVAGSDVWRAPRFSARRAVT